MSTTTTAELSPIVRALEAAYRMIQAKYPDAPNVAIVVKRDDRAWGHTTVNHVWHSHEATEAADLYEIMISGENLDRGAASVAATLIHEAAHARNIVNGIKDTDVNGRHNKRFKATAEEMGLTVSMYEGRGAYLGWTNTTLEDDGLKRWAKMLARIQAGMDKAAKARHYVPTPAKGTTGTEGEGEGTTVVIGPKGIRPPRAAPAAARSSKRCASAGTRSACHSECWTRPARNARNAIASSSPSD